MKAWREKNREKIRTYFRDYRKSHEWMWADYRAANRERLARKAREYRAANREAVSARGVARKRLKRANDPRFALIHRVRSRINSAYAGKLKPAATKRLIGCDFDFFKSYIESLFLDGMCWSDRKAWHIDHIIPLSSFNLEDEAEALKAFHYTNCQPLWAIDNLRKGKRK